MKKQRIRLTESQINRVIKESVRRILKENSTDCQGDFENDYTVVKSNGKYNHIDPEGNPISDQWWDYCGNFRNGYAVVELNGMRNFIDTKGRLLKNQWLPIR